MSGERRTHNALSDCAGVTMIEVLMGAAMAGTVLIAATTLYTKEQKAAKDFSTGVDFDALTNLLGVTILDDGLCSTAFQNNPFDEGSQLDVSIAGTKLVAGADLGGVKVADISLRNVTDLNPPAPDRKLATVQITADFQAANGENRQGSQRTTRKFTTVFEFTGSPAKIARCRRGASYKEICDTIAGVYATNPVESCTLSGAALCKGIPGAVYEAGPPEKCTLARPVEKSVGYFSQAPEKTVTLGAGPGAGLSANFLKRTKHPIGNYYIADATDAGELCAEIGMATTATPCEVIADPYKVYDPWTKKTYTVNEYSIKIGTFKRKVDAVYQQYYSPSSGSLTWLHATLRARSEIFSAYGFPGPSYSTNVLVNGEITMPYAWANELNCGRKVAGIKIPAGSTIGTRPCTDIIGVESMPSAFLENPIKGIPPEQL